MKRNDIPAVKILVVDDHPAIREGLVARIAKTDDLEITAEADNVAEALHLAAEKNPDLVITDITLKKGDGIGLIKRLIARRESTRILVWSMHSENFYAERALHAGARGYITKEQPTEQIIDAIRQVIDGKVYLRPEIREKMLHRTIGGSPVNSTSIDALSDRELEVFRYIGEGVRPKEIAERLHISVKTVDTHRDRIKKKLHLRDGTELIRRAAVWVAENP